MPTFRTPGEETDIRQKAGTHNAGKGNDRYHDTVRLLTASEGEKAKEYPDPKNTDPGMIDPGMVKET